MANILPLPEVTEQEYIIKSHQCSIKDAVEHIV